MLHLECHFLPCMSRALGGVILWMETQFDAAIVQNYVDLQSIVNITGGNDENMTSAILDLRTFERFRYI